MLNKLTNTLLTMIVYKGGIIMRFSELKKILNHEDSEVFSNIFEEGKFSYNEPVMID